MKQTAFSFLLLITIIACNNTKQKSNAGTTVVSSDFTEAATSPHLSHHKQYDDFNFTNEAQWDSLVGNTSKSEKTAQPENAPRSKPAAQHKVHSNYKTFGWHLYSKGSAYKNYNFSLLWGISYFSYIVDPETGGYKNIHQWKTTALVDSAKAHNTKVFLSVSNFGGHDNATFLNNKNAQKTLVDSLSVLLKLRDADGINIDFEGVSSTSRTAFNNFVVSISEQLKQIDSGYIISLALYAIDYHKVFDIKAINPHIDLYTLMSYDYHGGFSEYAGPVAPLKSSKTWGENSVESSVDYYLNEGVSPDQLIVGIPYYGAEWKVKTDAVPAKAEKFYANPTYSRIKDYYIDSLKAKVYDDKQSSANYFTVKNKDGILRQMWFEDSLSLARKYDWVKSKKLSGVGIWALSYDQENTELWELLAAKFGQEE